MIDQGHPTIRNCIITGNSAQRGGGIMCLDTATAPEIRNCQINDNEAVAASHDGKGGGIDGNYSVTVINTTFQDNTAAEWGGAFSIENVSLTASTNVTLVNCRFVGNECLNYGGAIYYDGDWYQLEDPPRILTITNCLFHDNHATNTAGSNGGGIWSAEYSEAFVSNCTFVENSSYHGGGGWAEYSTSGYIEAHVTNCIFYDNVATGASGDDFHEVTPGTTTISYSAMAQGLFTGTGNIALSVSPFVSSSNFNLACGTLCVNGGDPNASAAPGSGGFAVDTFDVDEDGSTSEKMPDLELRPRIDGARIDMGAYERPVSFCSGDADQSGEVNIDDLVAVITHWGCTNTPSICTGDIAGAPCGNGIVDIDDLVLVITTWNHSCGTSLTGTVEDWGSFTSVQDCMDAATLAYTPYSPEWVEYVEKCTLALCEAEIIDCD